MMVGREDDDDDVNRAEIGGNVVTEDDDKWRPRRPPDTLARVDAANESGSERRQQ